MRPDEAEAAAEIFAAFAEPEPLRYFGAGLASEPVTGVRSIGELPGQFAVRSTMFFIPAAQLPDRPTKGNRIVEADDRSWTVIQAEYAGDVDEWQIYVERGC